MSVNSIRKFLCFQHPRIILSQHGHPVTKQVWPLEKWMMRMLCLLHQLVPTMSHLLKFHSQRHPVKMFSSEDDLYSNLHPFSQNLLSAKILMMFFSLHYRWLLIPNQPHLLHNPVHLITTTVSRIIHPELTCTVQEGPLMLLALLAIEQVIRQKMFTRSSQKKTIGITACSAGECCINALS